MADGKVTDEELERLRAKIGERVTISEPPHLTEVTRDAIRHWAQATGDRAGDAQATRRGDQLFSLVILSTPHPMYASSAFTTLPPK